MVSFVREKKIQAGENYREADIYILSDRMRSTRRTKKEKVSRPAQRNLNDHNSKRYFVQLAEANFGEGDISLGLDYWQTPESVREAEKELRNFFRRLATRYKKKGLTLRYLGVTSDVDGATGAPKRVHHHVFISGGLSWQEIKDCWRRRRRKGEKAGRMIGRCNINELIPDKDFNISGKAYYFSRQGGGRKRWVGSMNLRKPVRLPDADTKYSIGQIGRMCTEDPEPLYGKDVAFMVNYKFWQKKFPGWRIVSYDPGHSLFSGWRITFKLRREVE